MIPATGETIIAKLQEESRRHPGGLVAFDGDGTLWSGDIGEDFFDAIVEHGDFRSPALDALRADAAEFGVETEGNGVTLARRLYAAYRDGTYPEERTCEMMTWACAGWRRDEVRAFTRRVVEERALSTRLHREVVRVLEWARASGATYYLVSASPREVVEAGAALVGITPDRVVAATALYDGDVMRAGVERPIPYGPGKVHGLESKMGTDGVLLGAFGDNAFDVAMLSRARVPVAVRPKDRLRARAHEVPNLYELTAET